MDRPFWQTKRLEQMSREEWESLCDGCGLCCLVRFEDENTGEVVPTRVHCRLFDSARCTCIDYANRREQVPDCIKLTPWNIEQLGWMPKSCDRCRGQASWKTSDCQRLSSGDPESVHAAGVSVRGQTVSELAFADSEYAVNLEAPEWNLERGG